MNSPNEMNKNLRQKILYGWYLLNFDGKHVKNKKKKTFWLLVCNYVLLDYFKYQNQLLIALKQPKDLLTKNSMKMLIF
jgi:hypothetical protein